MNENSWTIKGIDTVCTIEPYKRQTRGITRAAIVIDPESREIAVIQHEDSGSTPAPEWHWLMRRWTIDAYPDADEVREYLEGEARPLLNTIYDGYKTHYDGSNLRGLWSDEAQAAADEIASDIEALGSALTPYYAEEWLENVTAADLEGTTPEKLAADLIEQARMDGYQIVGDVEGLLADMLTSNED